MIGLKFDSHIHLLSLSDTQMATIATLATWTLQYTLALTCIAVTLNTSHVNTEVESFQTSQDSAASCVTAFSLFSNKICLLSVTAI